MVHIIFFEYFKGAFRQVDLSSVFSYILGTDGWKCVFVCTVFCGAN